MVNPSKSARDLLIKLLDKEIGKRREILKIVTKNYYDGRFTVMDRADIEDYETKVNQLCKAKAWVMSKGE